MRNALLIIEETEISVCFGINFVPFILLFSDDTLFPRVFNTCMSVLRFSYA
jgi:hypothetical protein